MPQPYKLKEFERITLLTNLADSSIFGGGGGIRTHGTLACTTVFETAPFDHSGTPPLNLYFIVVY
jgi:hypothetical protein